MSHRLPSLHVYQLVDRKDPEEKSPGFFLLVIVLPSAPIGFVFAPERAPKFAIIRALFWCNLNNRANLRGSNPHARAGPIGKLEPLLHIASIERALDPLGHGLCDIEDAKVAANGDKGAHARVFGVLNVSEVQPNS